MREKKKIIRIRSCVCVCVCVCVLFSFLFIVLGENDVYIDDKSEFFKSLNLLTNTDVTWKGIQETCLIHSSSFLSQRWDDKRASPHTVTHSEEVLLLKAGKKLSETSLCQHFLTP